MGHLKAVKKRWLENHESVVKYIIIKDGRVVDVDPLDWEKFKGAFSDRFFPLRWRRQSYLN